MACNVGGANPDSVTMVRASTRLAAVGMRFGGVRDLRQPHHRVALADRQVDQERRDLADRLARARRRPSSASGYTDIGAIARTVDVGVTGSPRDSSQLRSAPAITASTTSLTSQS